MSASDKKRQRKEAAEAQGLTQQELREQAKAKTAKRNKTIYTAVGVVCAVGAVALLVWNSHFWEKGAVAATIDGVDYKAADLQYYYSQVRNSEIQMAQYYAYYGIPATFDATVSDGEQWYSESDGKTYADYFREQALTSLQQTAVACKAAQEAGYTLSEAGEKELQENLSSFDKYAAQSNMTRGAYISYLYGGEVTEKVLTRNLRNDILADEYRQYYQDSQTYEDADLEAYYKEHADTLDSYTYRTFTVDGSVPVTTDDEGNEVEATDAEKEQAMQVAKAQADKAVKEIQEADDAEKAFIEAAPKYVAETSKDAYADESYSLREDILGSTLGSSDSAAYSWLIDSSRKAGDVTSIEVTNGYQVVLFLGRELITDPTVDIRHILIKAETSDEDETDENGQKIPSQAELDAAKAEAEALLEEWKSGEATAESFGKLAEEHSDDPGSASSGGQYKYVTQGWAFEGFNDWCFDSSRQPGDTGLVENPQAGQQGWHIMYFEKAEEPAWKGTAISAKQSSDQTEWFNGLMDASTAEAKDGMKYVGAANTAQPTPAESAEPEASTEPEASESPEA